MYRFEPQGADQRLWLEAATLSALFAEAGRAVAERLGGGRELGEELPPLDFALEAPDLGHLLVDWIDALVIRSEMGRRVLVRFEPLEVSDAQLTARAYGRRLVDISRNLQGASLHGIDVRPTRPGWAATVTLVG